MAPPITPQPPAPVAKPPVRAQPDREPLLLGQCIAPDDGSSSTLYLGLTRDQLAAARASSDAKLSSEDQERVVKLVRDKSIDVDVFIDDRLAATDFVGQIESAEKQGSKFTSSFLLSRYLQQRGEELKRVQPPAVLRNNLMPDSWYLLPMRQPFKAKVTGQPTSLDPDSFAWLAGRYGLESTDVCLPEVGGQTYLMVSGAALASDAFHKAVDPANRPLEIFAAEDALSALQEKGVVTTESLPGLEIAPDIVTGERATHRPLLDRDGEPLYLSPAEYFFLMKALRDAGGAEVQDRLRVIRPPEGTVPGMPGGKPWPTDPAAFGQDVAVGLQRACALDSRGLTNGQWTKFLEQLTALKAKEGMINPIGLPRVEALRAALLPLRPAGDAGQVSSVVQVVDVLESGDQAAVKAVLQNFATEIPSAPDGYSTAQEEMFHLPIFWWEVDVTIDKYTTSVTGLSRETVAFLERRLNQAGITDGIFRLSEKSGTEFPVVIFRQERAVIKTIDGALGELLDKLSDGVPEKQSIATVKETSVKEALANIGAKESERTQTVMGLIGSLLFVGVAIDQLSKLYGKIADGLWSGHKDISDAQLADRAGRDYWLDKGTGDFKNPRQAQIIQTARRLWEHRYGHPVSPDNVKGIHHGIQWRRCVRDAERQQGIKETLLNGKLNVEHDPLADFSSGQSGQAGSSEGGAQAVSQHDRVFLRAQPLTAEALDTYKRASLLYRQRTNCTDLNADLEVLASPVEEHEPSERVAMRDAWERALRDTMLDNARGKSGKTAIELYTSDLTAKAQRGEVEVIDPSVRARELRSTGQALSAGRSVFLRGPAGVGKTAVVEGLATDLASGSHSQFTALVASGTMLLELNVDALVGDASHAGDREGRLNRLMAEVDQLVEKGVRVVLFIDEVKKVGKADQVEGAVSILDTFKQRMSRKHPVTGLPKLQCIFATTNEEYAMLEELKLFDGAMESRSKFIEVDPMSVKDTVHGIMFRMRSGKVGEGQSRGTVARDGVEVRWDVPAIKPSNETRAAIQYLAEQLEILQPVEADPDSNSNPRKTTLAVDELVQDVRDRARAAGQPMPTELTRTDVETFLQGRASPAAKGKRAGNQPAGGGDLRSRALDWFGKLQGAIAQLQQHPKAATGDLARRLAEFESRAYSEVGQAVLQDEAALQRVTSELLTEWQGFVDEVQPTPPAPKGKPPRPGAPAPAPRGATPPPAVPTPPSAPGGKSGGTKALADAANAPKASVVPAPGSHRRAALLRAAGTQPVGAAPVDTTPRGTTLPRGTIGTRPTTPMRAAHVTAEDPRARVVARELPKVLERAPSAANPHGPRRSTARPGERPARPEPVRVRGR